MASGLNLRDIGEARKAALQAEAEAQGVSVADLVRQWIDDGLERTRVDRARAEWVRAAAPGIADEARHLDENNPNLGRFRRLRRR